MKMHRLEIYIVDFEDLGLDAHLQKLSNSRNFNGQIKDSGTADIGEWSDSHQINKLTTGVDVFRGYFETQSAKPLQMEPMEQLGQPGQSTIRVTRIELTAAQREGLTCKNKVNIPGFTGTLNAAENTGSSKEEKQSRTAIGNCWCEACVPQGSLLNPENTRMILCALCGNKRCPHATDHRNDCTQSNAPGQPGSSYAGVVAAFAAFDLADRENMDVKVPTSKIELATVWAYALPEGVKIESSPQRDGSMLWAIRQDRGCMGLDGQWWYESWASRRDDGLLKRCRFPSPQAAYDVWLHSETGAQYMGSKNLSNKKIDDKS